MLWSKFEEHFHSSWHSKIKKFIESKECDAIFEYIKSESKRGKKIAPESINLFRAFKETSLDDLKCVMIGLSPYHTLYNNKVIADGLLFGCSITERIQPSLDQFYNALEQEMCNGLNLGMYKNPDVSYLANQGVLMLNAALTTEINKPGNHLKIWEPFIKYLFEEIINITGVPIIFLGKEASVYKKYTAIFSNVFILSHPASASYNNTVWETGNTFRNVSKILKDTNNFKIEWINNK